METPAYNRLQAPNQALPQAETGLIFGIQGGQGSFNEEAIRYYLAQRQLAEARVAYLYTSTAVMDALCRGEIDRGQCAIYNSTGGYVAETVEALKQHPVIVVEEFEITIAHAMMIRPDADFLEITTLMAHPQVFAQCRQTLARKYPDLRQTSGEGALIDNAKAAEALAQKQLPRHVAVMGSRILAEIYGLRVVAENLQDLSHNLTRFALIERA